MAGESPRVVSVGAGALARGFVLPTFAAGGRGWRVVFASRYSSLTHPEMESMVTSGRVTKAIVEQAVIRDVAKSPERSVTSVDPWTGELESFDNTSNEKGLDALTGHLADPATKVVVLNARLGLEQLQTHIVSALRARPKTEPLLIVSAENRQPPCWPAFKDLCRSLPNVAITESVADRVCMSGIDASALQGRYGLVADVFTERHRQWYVLQDNLGLAHDLGLEAGAPAGSTQVVSDLEPIRVLKRLLVNGVQLAAALYAAAADQSRLDRFLLASKPRTTAIRFGPEVPGRQVFEALLEDLRTVCAVHLERYEERGFPIRSMIDDWVASTARRLPSFPDSVPRLLRDMHPSTEAQFREMLDTRLYQPAAVLERVTRTERTVLHGAVRLADTLWKARVWERWEAR